MAKTKEYKFGVDRLAKDLGINAASVRVGLRKHKVKKNEDNTYGWESRTGYDKVLALWDKEDKKPAAKSKTVAKKKTAKKAVARAKPRANGEAHAE